MRILMWRRHFDEGKRESIPMRFVLILFVSLPLPGLAQTELPPFRVDGLDLDADSRLTKSRWVEVCDTPDGYVPQGLATDGKRLYLSVHRSDRESMIFRFDERDESWTLLFKMPAEAHHTSGIAFHPTNTNRLLAVDYGTNKIYVIDFKKSCEMSMPIIISEQSSGLKGTSACCFAETKPGNWEFIVTDFSRSNTNVFFRFESGKLERVESRHYRNLGFSQGITYHDGFVYETGNRLFTSYVVKHRLGESLGKGKIKALATIAGPSRMIEDIVFYRGVAHVTDEHHNRLYRLESTKRKEKK